MSSIAISSLVFVCIIGGALFGFYFRQALPNHHLSEETMRAVTLGTGLIATLSAIVLGMLISSAKISFDDIEGEIRQTTIKIILLDHALVNYGPETKEARNLFRRSFASNIEMVFAEKNSKLLRLDASKRLAGLNKFQAQLMDLVPRDHAQRLLRSRAIALSDDIAQMHWLLLSPQEKGAIMTPFLASLVFWLAIIFFGFGLYTVNNSTVFATLLICALAVSSAIFLLEELGARPIEGLMQISSAPLHDALAHFGQ